MATLALTDAELEAIAVKVYAKMVPGAPAPAPAPVPPVVPPPPPVGTGISPRWDALRSQWAKWNFITTTEQMRLLEQYGQNAVMNHIQWYQGYHRLDGRMNADGTYDYVDKYLMGSPSWVRDANGSADARHLASLGATPQIAPLG